MKMKQIGARIRALREKQGMTQQELADRLQVTRQTVSHYEIGRSQPDLEMLECIANVLNVDVALLLGNGQTSVRVPVRSKLEQIRAGGRIPWSAVVAFLLIMPAVYFFLDLYLCNIGFGSHVYYENLFQPYLWPALLLPIFMGVDYLLEQQGKTLRWRLREGAAALMLLFVFSMAVWQESADDTRAQYEKEYWECKQFRGIVVELVPQPEGPSPGFDPEADYHLVIYEGYIHDYNYRPESLIYFTYAWEDPYVFPIWKTDQRDWQVGDLVDVTVLYRPSQDVGEAPIWPVYDVKNHGKPKKLHPWFERWLQEWTQK